MRLRSFPMLRLTPAVYAEMVGDCYDGLPNEACGLLGGGPGTAKATVCYRTRNVAESAKLYTVDPGDHLRSDRDAESRGLVILGVYHSHTHTPAYPSPTDVTQAPDPDWHYVIVSLGDEAPVLRSYRIIGGNITEEPVVLQSK